MMRAECSDGSDSYEFTKVQLFTRILLPSKPVPFDGNHLPPTSFIDRPFAPLLPEAVRPKGEWLSIRGCALHCTGSRLNAFRFPYCASWRRGSAGEMESWVTKAREESVWAFLILINCLRGTYSSSEYSSVKNNYIRNLKKEKISFLFYRIYLFLLII